MKEIMQQVFEKLQKGLYNELPLYKPGDSLYLCNMIPFGNKYQAEPFFNAFIRPNEEERIEFKMHRGMSWLCCNTASPNTDNTEDNMIRLMLAQLVVLLAEDEENIKYALLGNTNQSNT